MNSRDEAAQQQDEEEKVRRCWELYYEAFEASKLGGFFNDTDLKDLKYFLGLNKEPS